jgi:hypothetical protein
VTLPTGAQTTISGTATDTGGGVVGGVEVSTDGGSSWHPAAGRGTWTYTWIPGAPGPVTLTARATDDSANIGSPAAIGVTVAPRACPCSVWDAAATPGTPADPDTSAVEVGLKFRSTVAAAVTGVRFYKGSGNTGTHVGHLWSGSGTLLGTVTFSGETGSGWQRATFAAPLPISAGTTYVVSYYAPNGHYADDTGYFATSGVDSTPLRALADGEDGFNGVYHYGSGGGFPTNSWQASNYWVDVIVTT